ncbi:MAG: hypothetical protein QOK15_2032 [Nocardioidaceae bacterium]|nr:hypothetical protein [Nocardioidaceae bacterium]
MEAHGSSLLMELPPLAIVGGAFLVGLDMVRHERHPGGARAGHLRRRATILLLFVASLAHVPVIPAHLKEAPYMGVLFILFTTAAFLLAAVLAARPAPVLYPVAAVLCAAAVLAYAATRIIAFPELADDVGNWTEPLGMVSVAAELGVVLVSTVAARRTVHEVRAEHA